ncbi:MAG: hypothetical protein R3E83_21765 [Burkholderiaceae bacterium]
MTLALAPLMSLASPRTVATIKPLHGVLAAVMQGVDTPTLLLDGTSSPHAINLRPSQTRARPTPT